MPAFAGMTGFFACRDIKVASVGSKLTRRVAAFAMVLAAMLGWPAGTLGEPAAPVPAKRLIATSPHLTELVYYAGAGDLLVGVAPFADYPPAARALPIVGGPGGLNIEAILEMRPDRVLIWESGTPAWQVERLRSVGIHVWVSEIRRLEDIPAWLQRFGSITGRERAAEAAARKFNARLHALERHAQGRTPRRVFLQVLDRSLYTFSDRHVVSDVLRRCGGRNVMGSLPALAPRVELESVLAADPDVIIASGDPLQWEEWRARWQRYPQLSAVKHGRLVFIPADFLHRPGPRLLDGMERLCAALEG